MDFPSKIQEVRENIAAWQKEQGDDFVYLITGFATENAFTGEMDFYLGIPEHKEIVKYLAKTGFLEIIEEKPDSFHITVLPKAKPSIKPKTLELMTRELKDCYTGLGIVRLLKETGVDDRLIVYPESKWAVFYKVFSELTISKNKTDEDLLFKLICETIHPLNLGGSMEKAKELQAKFNEYLKYDDLEIYEIGGRFFISDSADSIPKEDIDSLSEQQEREQLEFLSKPENKDKISLVRKTYQSLMNVIEEFCRNFPRLTRDDMAELNKHYLNLDKLVWNTIDELRLDGIFEEYKKYPRPFTNLFSAEKEHNGDISWDTIRPEMSARLGEIETLYLRVNASDILAEPDKQKKLNDIQLYLSELKEKTKEIKKQEKLQETPSAKIEITAMPPIELKETKKESISKFPHKLPAGTKWENFTIKFLDDENIFIQVKHIKHETNYKEMRFVGKGKNPNPSEAWVLLKVLAKVNGELTIKDAEARDKYKKQKEALAKALQSYFSLDYDPFYPYHSSPEKEGDSYKIKITLIPPPEQIGKESIDEDDLGIKEYLDKQAPQVYEEQ